MSILATTVRSQEAGADLFLKKPLIQHRLVDAVSGVLANPQGGQQNAASPRLPSCQFRTD